MFGETAQLHRSSRRICDFFTIARFDGNVRGYTGDEDIVYSRRSRYAPYVSPIVRDVDIESTWVFRFFHVYTYAIRASVCMHTCMHVCTYVHAYVGTYGMYVGYLSFKRVRYLI